MFHKLVTKVRLGCQVAEWNSLARFYPYVVYLHTSVVCPYRVKEMVVVCKIDAKLKVVFPNVFAFSLCLVLVFILIFEIHFP